MRRSCRAMRAQRAREQRRARRASATARWCGGLRRAGARSGRAPRAGRARRPSSSGRARPPRRAGSASRRDWRRCRSAARRARATAPARWRRSRGTPPAARGAGGSRAARAARPGSAWSAFDTVSWNRAQSVGIPNNLDRPTVNAVEHLLGSAGAGAPRQARGARSAATQALSYAELAAEVARAAGALRALGVAPGERVLLMMRDTPEFAAAWLGAVHAGAVAIALNTRLSEAEYRHIRADSGARLAIVEDVFARARPDLATEHAAEGSLAIAGASAGRRLVLARGARARGAEPCAHPARGGGPGVLAVLLGHHGQAQGHHSRAPQLVAGRAGAARGGRARRRRAQLRHFQAFLRLRARARPARSAGHRRHRDPGTGLAGCRDGAGAGRAATGRTRSSACRRSTVSLLALGAERLAPFRGVRRFVAAGERVPAPAHRAVARRDRRGNPLPLRHVRDVLRLHGDAAGDLERHAHRQAARAASTRNCATRTAGRRRRAKRPSCGCGIPRSRSATPIAPSRPRRSSATAGSAPGTCSCATAKDSSCTRAAPTNW